MAVPQFQFVDDPMALLLTAKSASIKQRFELFEVITGCETNNQYYVSTIDGEGNKKYLFKAKENSSCFCRNCCPGSSREFNLDLKNKESKTALMIAIENKNQKSARELIVKGASVKERNKGDMSPLMIACKVGMNDIAEMLIKSGADVNEKNILGETPVKIAQINGNEELAMKLITTYKAGI